MGLEEDVYAEPVLRLENDIHPIVESDTGEATVDATDDATVDAFSMISYFLRGEKLQEEDVVKDKVTYQG